MSHTTSIKGIEILSASAVARAVAFMQSKGVAVELKHNTKARAYYNNQEGMDKPAELCLHLPTARYDVGLYLNKEGSYEPRFDVFMGEVHKHLGAKGSDRNSNNHVEHIGGFLQEYAVAAAELSAESQGKYVQRIEQKDGTVQLAITGY